LKEILYSEMSHLLDICFVIDATFSMKYPISLIRHHLLAFMEDLKRLPTDYSLQVSLVLYKDYGKPTTNQTRPVDVIHFSADINRVIRRLELETCEGVDGNTDTAEAVLDGLQEAISLEWRRGSNRLLILVGDAPPHGMRYYDESFEGKYQDRFDDDPTGETVESITHALMRNGIAVIAVALSEFGPANPIPEIVDTVWKYFATHTGGMWTRAINENTLRQLFRAISDATILDRDVVFKKQREQGQENQDGQRRHLPAAPGLMISHSAAAISNRFNASQDAVHQEQGATATPSAPSLLHSQSAMDSSTAPTPMGPPQMMAAPALGLTPRRRYPVQGRPLGPPTLMPTPLAPMMSDLSTIQSEDNQSYMTVESSESLNQPPFLMAMLPPPPAMPVPEYPTAPLLGTTSATSTASTNSEASMQTESSSTTRS
jgi:hypothetical protein